MTLTRQAEISNAARALLNELWLKRDQIWNPPPTLETLIPVRTDVIVRSLLGIRLEEPEAIAPESTGAEIAGFIDREEGRIVVAQKYRCEWRRFTMAHEIGHWVLHPQMRLRRERPLTGAERANGSRPAEEQEADLFAAELVMPRKPLTTYFQQHFGRPVSDAASSELISWLSRGDRRVNEIEFRRSRRFRAMVVSQTSCCGPTIPFPPLAARFEVSATAMAIRLEDLGLVT